MDETLILKAEPVMRERLRALFWIRLSSAAAVLLPALACTAYLWARSQTPLPIEEGEPAGPGLISVVWGVWLPLAFLSLAAGGVLAWLAFRAYRGYRREFHLTASGLERRDVGRARRLRWAQVLLVETGRDFTFKTRDESWNVPGDWLGRDQAQALEAWLKGHLPKEKLAPAATAIEIALDRTMRLLPTLFALLLAAITAVAMYWVFLRKAR